MDPFNQHQSNVTRFFDSYAGDFYDIYGRENASTLEGIVDKYTRKSMFLRFKKTFEQCHTLKIKSLLDVGCGPGTHDIILSSELGIKVVGIDVASRMIEFARAAAKKCGVEHNCTYSVTDFMEFTSGREFDMAISLGVIEYINNPVAFIKKLISHSNKCIIFSLPVKWHILTPQRLIRYKIRNCPLRFYSKTDVIKLMINCDINKFEIKRLSRDFLITAFNEQ